MLGRTFADDDVGGDDDEDDAAASEACFLMGKAACWTIFTTSLIVGV